MKRAGFTFTELLIVIGSLCIFSFAFLSLSTHCGGRENSRRSSCQSNLKQIGLAFKQYTQDYDEKLPTFNVGRVGVTVSGHLTVSYWVQSLQPYAKSVQIFQCPSENNSLGTDYYYSRGVSGVEDTKFNNSANTVLLTEGTDTSNGAMATATAPIKLGNQPPYARHLDGSNYSFVDGHVKWLQSARAAANSGVAARLGGFTFGS